MKKVVVPRQLPKYVSKNQMIRRAGAEMRESLDFLRFWSFLNRGGLVKTKKTKRNDRK